MTKLIIPHLLPHWLCRFYFLFLLKFVFSPRLSALASPVRLFLLILLLLLMFTWKKFFLLIHVCFFLSGCRRLEYQSHSLTLLSLAGVDVECSTEHKLIRFEHEFLFFRYFSCIPFRSLTHSRPSPPQFFIFPCIFIRHLNGKHRRRLKEKCKLSNSDRSWMEWNFSFFTTENYLFISR